ncbi:MAG: tetratricopeptide repeat protein, partial [Candidatus Hodarchaeales archaeon]
MSSRDAAKIQVERGRFDKAAKLYIKAAAEHQEANKPDLALEDFEKAIEYEEKSEKQKKLFDYLKNAFSFSKTHDEDRASEWAEKLIPIVKRKNADLNPSKKQKDLAKNYEYLASLFLAINNLDEQKSSLASSGDYYGEVALKKLDSKKEANVLEASSIFNQAISLYLKAERPEKVLELRFKEVGLNLSYQRQAETDSVIKKIQSFIEEIPPDEKPMFLHEVFQELSKIYVREGSKFLLEKKKEEIIQIGSKYFEIAREFSSQGKATEQIPAIWVQEGTTHLDIGRIKEAFSSFSSAIKVAIEVNNPAALKQAIQKLIKQGFNESIQIVDSRRLDKEKMTYSNNPGAKLFEKAKEIMKEMDLYKDQGADLADRLIEIGKSIIGRHQEFQAALEYFLRPSEVLIEIEEQNRGTELASYLAGLDSQLIKGQNFQQSSKYSELISKILDSFDQKDRKAELYTNRAEAFFAISRFEDAHLALKSASEIFLQLENFTSAENAARTLHEKGSRLIESGNAEIGLPLTIDANSIYEQTNSNKIRADNFRLRAESFLKANMNLEGFNDFKKAAEVFREIEDKENSIKIAQRASEVAIAFVRQKEKKLGHEISEFALEVLKDLKCDDLIPEIVFQKGTAYREIGDLDRALKELNRSAEGFIALKDIERAATIADELLQIALSLISTKTLEIGQQYAESSTSIYKSIKEGKKEGLALSQIGEAFYETGSIDTAIEFFDNAIEVLKKAKEKELLAGAYSAKGKSLKAKALSLVPSDGQAVIDLSQMIQEAFEKAGIPEKGVETVDELASKLIGIENYDSGIVLANGVADSYIKLGKKDSAEQALSKVAELLVAKD